MPAEPTPAATVVLLRDRPGGPEVLMVRRHERAADFAGVSVFPGGLVDASDADPDLAPPDSGFSLERALAALGEPLERGRGAITVRRCVSRAIRGSRPVARPAHRRRCLAPALRAPARPTGGNSVLASRIGPRRLCAGARAIDAVRSLDHSGVPEATMGHTLLRRRSSRRSDRGVRRHGDQRGGVAHACGGARIPTVQESTSWRRRRSAYSRNSVSLVRRRAPAPHSAPPAHLAPSSPCRSATHPSSRWCTRVTGTIPRAAAAGSIASFSTAAAGRASARAAEEVELLRHANRPGRSRPLRWNCRSSSRDRRPAPLEGAQQRGLASVEPQRVEGVRQIEQRHVDVVADLVEESAQEGPRLHHVSVRGREHPYADFAFSILEASVQAMEFALPTAGAGA